MSAMTALYRYFDADELLLYVGISKQPINRLGQHRQDKSWWEQISTVRIERYRTRAEALDAERDAIINECPIYNIVHNGRHAQRVGRAGCSAAPVSPALTKATAYDARVSALLLLADAIAETHEQDEDFCANAYWYGAHLDPGLRDAVCALTGWSAIHWSSDHWMRSKEAYDAVYGATYDRLPDCQPECWCANTGHGAELRALLADVPSGGTIAPLFTPRAIDPPDYDAMGSLEDFALLFGDEMGVR